MQTQKLSAMFGFVFLLAAVARADTVTSDHDHTVNFSKYKTFMWVHEPEPTVAFMKERIIASVNAQLVARGMRQVNDGADLAVGANMATEEKHTWETYYNGDGWGWGAGWAVTKEKTYEVGTLTVDLFDAHSRKLVWQGIGTDTVSTKPEKRNRDTDKEIEKMFKHFPGETEN